MGSSRTKGEFPREQRRLIVGALIERDGPGCFYCGCDFVDAPAPSGRTGDRSCTIDLFMPRSMGGTKDLANLRLSCQKCNRTKDDGHGWTFLQSRYLTRRRRVIDQERNLAAGLRANGNGYRHAEVVRAPGEAPSCAACGVVGSDEARLDAVPCSSVMVALGGGGCSRQDTP